MKLPPKRKWYNIAKLAYDRGKRGDEIMDYVLMRARRILETDNLAGFMPVINEQVEKVKVLESIEQSQK